MELALWGEFLGSFLDYFISQDMRKAKAEEFMNLKQGKMSVKQYTLKF